MAPKLRNYAPKEFEEAGQELWDEIMSLYALRPDERRVLKDACHEVDLIERLESRLAHAHLLVKGSRQQVRLNAVVSEIRQHRLTLASLFRQLKLDEVDTVGATTGAEDKNERTNQARRAASTRWQTRAG